MPKRICVIDGDMRNIELVNLFVQKGIDCKAFFNGTKDNSIKEFIKGAQAVVLPLNSSDYDLDWISFEEICRHLEKGTVLFAGKPNNEVVLHTERFGLITKYLLCDEAFLIENSFITAEGAIASAIINSKGTLIDSICVIIGSGRIAAALFYYLKAFTNKTRMVSRNIDRLAKFRMQGCEVYHMDKQDIALNKAEYVFNTVPARVLEKVALEQMNENSLYIELASSPYGYDENDVPHHVKYIKEPGIPGRISPKAAASAMMDFIIREMEVCSKWN